MSRPPCHRLDDFLDRALPDDEREAFAAHLPDCPTCREAVREQEGLNELLRRAVAELQPVPEGLAERARRRIRSAARRRLLAGVAGVAATVTAAAVGLAWLNRPPPPPDEPPPPPERVEGPTPAPPAPDPRMAVRVDFGPRAPLISVPVPTESPNVTIIWVYPTSATAAPADEASLSEKEGS